MRIAPFAQMQPEHVDRFIAGAQQAYFAPGETVLAPATAWSTHLLCIRQGSVTGRRGPAEADAAASSTRPATCSRSAR